LERLNGKTDIIGFDNGVYDLKEKIFRKATIEDCVSWSVGYDYVDESECDPDTLAYLENFVFSLFENRDTGSYFLKHIGSFLFGGNKEELIHFWVGNGRNGKGTVDDLLRQTLGPYYQVLDDSFFTTSKKNQDEASPAMMALKNVRLTMTTEPEGTTSYLSSKFKRLCGNDPIHCRSLYSNAMQTFVPTFKPVIQTNHLPQFTDVDIGLLQRIRVINFCYTFVKPTEYQPENKNHKLIDINLKTNLRKMKGEFMTLLIKWYHIYTIESLDYPSKDIIEFTSKYRADIDSVQTFVNTATRACPGESISIIDLLYGYNGWYKEKMQRNIFAQRLKGNFKIGNAKIYGRMLTCLVDRTWHSDFVPPTSS
jgi:putative DNA primase/helicase